MEPKGKNIILEKTFEFSLKIIKFCDELESLKKYVIAKQLLRSGTSIGANVREAQSPQSRADFIHKLKIALKEVEETEYWLLLINASDSYPTNEQLVKDILALKLILSKIVSTSKGNYFSEPEQEYFTSDQFSN